MNKRFIYTGLLVLGFVVGIVMMTVSDNVNDGRWPDKLTGVDEFDTDVSLQTLASNTSEVMDDSDDFAPAQSLEDKVAELEARVLELEQALDPESEASANARANSQANTQDLATSARFNRQSRLLTTKSLVKSGIDQAIAADIVRRRNEIELSKLQLLDRATREGYIGTARYTKELSALLTGATSLREDLGDDSYDNYLYANKRPNRVKARSVMQGSAAEQAGMKDGDIILTYGELRVFEWNELKLETSKGELDEYVNVDILRDGQQMSLWMPRGPLGVRLGVGRVQP